MLSKDGDKATKNQECGMGRMDYNCFVIALAFLSVFTETFLPAFSLKANLNAVFL